MSFERVQEMRNIDVLISERIMDYVVKRDFPVNAVHTGTPTPTSFQIFRPSFHISDAWKVLEKFHAHTLTFRNLDDTDYHECWIVDYSGTGEAKEAYGKHETAPMAICIAALKVRGVEVNV